MAQLKAPLARRRHVWHKELTSDLMSNDDDDRHSTSVKKLPISRTYPANPTCTTKFVLFIVGSLFPTRSDHPSVFTVRRVRHKIGEVHVAQHHSSLTFPRQQVCQKNNTANAHSVPNCERVVTSTQTATAHSKTRAPQIESDLVEESNPAKFRHARLTRDFFR